MKEGEEGEKGKKKRQIIDYNVLLSPLLLPV